MQNRMPRDPTLPKRDLHRNRLLFRRVHGVMAQRTNVRRVQRQNGPVLAPADPG